MTIEQIQTMIDNKADVREVINQIADYLQSNPGGGGVTLYSGDGSIASDRIVDLNGKDLYFSDPTFGFLLYLDQASFASQLRASDGTANASLDLTADAVGGGVGFDIRSADGSGGQARILGDGVAKTITLTAANGVIMPVQSFADNAAAITGGLAVGTIYRTGDLMKIVH